MPKMILMTYWELLGVVLCCLGMGLAAGIMFMMPVPDTTKSCNLNQGRGPK